MARWRGDVDLAARIADFLVDHAVKRGRAFADGCVVLRLTVDAADGLLIEVDDADPELPSATRAGHGHGVRLSWQGKQDGNTVVGKTVSARLTAPDLAGESA
ncbi:hypothetical protein [Streptomyces sp. NPDC021356]|uniref:hypothetical protein n=1 Tax=Streptomyces sp. NPDC021356 TaxID=3154900 RepID=UPI0033D43BB5